LVTSPAPVIGPVWNVSVATPRPVVDSITVTPSIIPAGGGSVLVRVKVEHARRCAFLGQHAAFARLVLRHTVNCAAGHASARLPVAPNRYGKAIALRFVVTATDARSRSVRRGVAVVQMPRDPESPSSPKVPPLEIDSSGLPDAVVGTSYAESLIASGGMPPYTWSIVSGSLAPGLSLSADGIITGTPSVPGNFAFSVAVTDSQGRSEQALLTLAVAPPPIPTIASPNWAGWVLSGATYTGVSGTFNVPTIYASPTDTSTAEWVGIDGTGPSNPTILQLGVAEDCFVATNSCYIRPWIELLPQPPIYLPLAVTFGNRVTVAIVQAGSGVWTVGIKNESTGQAWAANVGYSGPAQSAEWIVEAPFDVRSGTVAPLGRFSPVTFSPWGVSPQPAQGSLMRVVLIQGGQTVATPSLTSSNGFTVASGAVASAAP
jgi:hypothetical protein